MKKSTLYRMVLVASAAMPLMMSAQTIGNNIYDQSPWANEQVLKLFSAAWDEGRNYPTFEELEKIGMNYIDLEMVRSHSRFRDISKDASRDIVSDINHDRRLWCNLPAGYGKHTGGYPSAQFDQDVFSMWNYTHLFGSWNYGFLLAPGCWVDAAHRNGTRIYSGIKFFESWNNDGSEGAFQSFIQTKNNDGTYKYARAFVNAASFFGNDGYNYNQEGTTYQTKDWRLFHEAVMTEARNLGLTGFGIGQYTQNSGLYTSNCETLYGNANGKIFDCMLNYSGGDFAWRGVSGSLTAAKDIVGSAADLYQGVWIVGLAERSWTQMNTDATKEMNICLWGEHDQSRFFQFRVGEGPMSVQSNYQALLEKAFSGGNRNPLDRPAISNDWGKFQVADASLAGTQLIKSPGFASMVAERSAINFALPFETHFSLGNGESYFYKGKVTSGSWYNMSQQDIVPTYRWLVSQKGDMTKVSKDIAAEFTHEDAYIGGSSLRLSGATSAGADIVLYRTNLTVSAGTPKLTIAAKGAAGESHLSVILRKKGSDAWIEVPFGDFAATTWEEKTLDVPSVGQDDVIEYIGLRVNGSTTADWKALVGKLKLADGRAVNPAMIDPESVIAEVVQEYSDQLTVKLGWKPDYSSFETSINEFGMVYNDEINTDHFEIFYKEGENGKAKEIGRTAQWATAIFNLPTTQSTEDYIGVRAVSVDLEHCSPVVWVAIGHSTGDLDPFKPAEEEEKSYGESNQVSVGNGTLEQCWQNIFVETVKTEGATEDLDFHVTKNPVPIEANQYYYAEDHKLVLNQGQTVKLFFKGNEASGGGCLKYCFVNAYIDYDGNYSFLDADETLGKIGNLNAGTDAIVNPGITIEFTVPEDACVGPSRLRFVGSDAWTPHPGPVGGTVKGYSLDFPVEIQGTNPSRGATETYLDRRDQGEVEEPEFLAEGNIYNSINGVNADAELAAVEIVDGVAYFTNCQKAWMYDVEGRCVKFVNGETSVSVRDLTAGVYVVKMLNGQVIRATKVAIK